MSSQQAPKAAASKAHKLSSLSHLVLASLVLAFASSVASCPTQRLARDRTARRQDRAATRPSEGESRPERSIEMKSRRQSSGGNSAACAAGEANTHTHSSGGGGCKLERKDVEKNRRPHMRSSLPCAVAPDSRCRLASFTPSRRRDMGRGERRTLFCVSFRPVAKMRRADGSAVGAGI